MELSDLVIFQAVVEAGGVSRAANKLHRVQSNITTRVRQLEKKLGVELFVREGRRMRLSPAGAILRDQSKKLLELARETREAVQDSEPRGVLRLGAMESTSSVRLPVPLSRFHRRYPEVKIELRSGNPQQLTAQLLAGEIDVALVAEPVSDERLERARIYEEELVIIAPRDQRRIRTVADLKEKAILAFEHGCPHRKRLEDWLARDGKLPEQVIEISSYHALLGCVVAGMGIALMPKSVLATFPDRALLSVHALPPGQDTASTVMIWQKGMRSAKVDALKEVLLAAKDNPARKAGKKSRYSSL
jgi:DNA-binding transcriptional LysR family regulator